ncbi:MFS transporter [Lactobacillus gasseri]|nr:MFS transporter [Lactobacillus gasseri]MDE1535515.1 MFS transporter [Lactobacillus gasseri]
MTDFLHRGNQTQSFIQLVNMIMLIFGILMGLVAGPLSNKFKILKLPVGLSTILLAIAGLSLFFLRNNTGIILYALAAGLGMGLWNALDNLLNLKVIPDQNRVAFFLGVYNLGNTITQAIAPVLAAAVISLFGYSGIFIVSFIFSLIGSVGFGIYKNFTAIDTHTVRETEIIKQQIVDTNQVESFVKSFAKDYFSWQQSQEAIDKRNEKLTHYLTEELQVLNEEMIRKDIPTSSSVNDIQVWQVSQVNENTFEVLFSVEQVITEDKDKETISSSFHVVVHIDESDNMVIIKNPTMSKKPQKSDYQPKQLESDHTVDTETMDEITSFLETFFQLYPTATEKELTYYVSNHVLPMINKEYVFEELVNPIFTRKDNQVIVNVAVKYLDQETKATQISQFELILEKQDNWKIVK